MSSSINCIFGILTASIIMLAITFTSCTEPPRDAYPKREGDRLYTTDSTFHIMDGDDTLSRLINAHTLEVVE